MKPKHLLFLFILPFSIFAQDPHDCELVHIDCCDFDLTEQTLTIQASNQSTNIFSYPGFILFDNNMDTLAIETVNYYGIGTFPQAHKLDIIKPVLLPFEGYLELHTLFFGEYACTFPLSISDTSTVGIANNPALKSISIYPNPASDVVNICFEQKNSNKRLSVKIIDNIGREVYSKSLHQTDSKIPLTNLKPGIYLLLLRDEYNQTIFNEKLILK